MDEFGKSPLNPHLLIVVKSKIDNFERRTAIRNSWGFEKRFSDVLIRTVFSLGIDQKTHDGEPSALQKLVDVEADRFGDIVQFNFIDAYFNNTLKTVNNMRWCKEFCIRSKFFLFVDDDFYVSIKNVLSFLRNPVDYPEYLEEYKEQLRKLNQRRILTANGSSSIAASSSRNLLNLNMELPAGVKLFSGFVFNSAPHRHKSSKWYVSLEEYPYDMWPSYVTAGSFVMSREALSEMYCASMYTKHFRWELVRVNGNWRDGDNRKIVFSFRFDDIFLGIVAMKARIQPLHSEEFYFYKATYNGPASYRYVLASHGYDNPDEMVKVWNEVRSNGYAWENLKTQVKFTVWYSEVLVWTDDWWVIKICARWVFSHYLRLEKKTRIRLEQISM